MTSGTPEYLAQFVPTGFRNYDSFPRSIVRKKVMAELEKLARRGKWQESSRPF